MNTFAILSLAYGNKEYLDALEDVIWAICDEYTWCLPAHLSCQSTSVIGALNDNRASTPGLKPFFREHKKEIDLFSAEIGFALAEILYLLKDRLSPLVVHRAQKEITERVLESYCEINSMFWWETAEMNWAAVCAASVGAAAIYLIEDDSVLAPVIYRILGAMECYLTGFNEDGACIEGLAYWNYGFGFYVYFAALLKQRTAGRIDMMDSSKVKQIALFQQKCYLSENKVISFSDGFLTFNYSIGLSHFLKALFDEVVIPPLEYRAGFTEDHGYRWASGIRNFVWSSREFGINHEYKEAVHYMTDAQWFIARKVKGKGSFCFAAKGGHNAEPHNHNDLGSFILHVNGETLLADIGCGEYTKQYFAEERYDFFCNSSRGHSVPIINGCYQQQGKEYRAVITRVESTDTEDHLEMDLSKAYDVKCLKSLVRSFYLDNSACPKLILKDEYIFDSKPCSIVERFVTFNAPAIVEPGKIKLEGLKGSVDISFDPRQMECSIGKELFIDHRSNSIDVYTIDLHPMYSALKLCTEISFAPKGDGSVPKGDGSILAHVP